MTPTARSLKLLREAGYLADVVERWIAGKIRKDYLQVADIIGLKADVMPLLVQATTASNAAVRVRKIREVAPPSLFLCANVVVHGWSKRGKRGERKTWQCTVTRIEP